MQYDCEFIVHSLYFSIVRIISLKAKKREGPVETSAGNGAERMSKIHSSSRRVQDEGASLHELPAYFMMSAMQRPQWRYQ